MRKLEAVDGTPILDVKPVLSSDVGSAEGGRGDCSARTASPAPDGYLGAHQDRWVPVEVRVVKKTPSSLAIRASLGPRCSTRAPIIGPSGAASQGVDVSSAERALPYERLVLHPATRAGRARSYETRAQRPAEMSFTPPLARVGREPLARLGQREGDPTDIDRSAVEDLDEVIVQARLARAPQRLAEVLRLRILTASRDTFPEPDRVPRLARGGRLVASELAQVAEPPAEEHREHGGREGEAHEVEAGEPAPETEKRSSRPSAKAVLSAISRIRTSVGPIRP